MYRLEVNHTAHPDLSGLSAQTQERVNRAIERLAQNPRPPDNKKLTAREGYKIRVGDYRILYQIDDGAKVVVIYRVMPRGDVYRV